MSSSAPSQHRLLVSGHPVAYRVRRSQRARRAAVHIHPRRGLEVVLPESVPEAEAGALLQEKRAWLSRHATEILRSGRELHLRTGAQLPYRGRWLPLAIAPGPKATLRLGPNDDRIIALLPAPSDQDSVRRTLTEWYRARARAHLLDAVSRLHDPADGRVRRLSVRDQDSCWGSCSSAGSLSFNWRLVMAPPQVLDAVVAHELVHLSQLDHSAGFWQRLDARFPRHRACRRWLDANAYRLTL